MSNIIFSMIRGTKKTTGGYLIVDPLDEATDFEIGTTFHSNSLLEYNKIHKELVIHFNEQKKKKLLQWPKTFMEKKKRLFSAREDEE